MSKYNLIGGYNENTVSSSEKKKLRFIDFFAGIGGFRIGMELAGHKCVGFCEWDKYATASYTSMHLITDKQREYLSTLTLKKRQKEILKDEYRNGEWYSNDIRNVDAGSLPTADCWCFGAPCQDFSIAGKRAGLEGDRSSLIREIFRLLEEQEEQNRPEWLIYENVKGMFSSNRGLDYLSILSEMDRLGYDIEWQNINSKWFVPQNRERIYTIGHLRRCGSRKVLPIERPGGENSVCQLGQLYGTEKECNPSGGRVYDPSGIAPTTGAGHGMSQPQIGLPCFVDMNYGAGIKETDYARTLQARYYKGISNRSGEASGVAIKIIGEVNSSQDGQIHDISGISKCHSSGHNNSPKVAIPVLTPDRAEKRQNGRRFKENGEPMFTLTTQDRHGVGIEVIGKCEGPSFIGNESRKRIYSDKGIAPCLNGIGNGGNTEPKIAIRVEEAANNVFVCKESGIFVEMPEGFIVYAVWYEKEQCYIAIRRLTPKECFRLQGWVDNYFERAAFVNSDSQLYKQAGNGVTVPVVEAIAKNMMK